MSSLFLNNMTSVNIELALPPGPRGQVVFVESGQNLHFTPVHSVVFPSPPLALPAIPVISSILGYSIFQS